MKLTVNHTTRYTYSAAASYALLQLRVCPQSGINQTVRAWSMEMTGAQHQASFKDQHGNHVDLVELLPDAETVTLSVSGEIETHNQSGITGRHDLAMPTWFYSRQTDLTQPGETLNRFLADLEFDHAEGLSGLHRLSAAILNRVPYTLGQTDTLTNAEEALKKKFGVCQDHSHIFLGAARKMGFPARYVSGYLMMNDRIDQEASHAWAEAYIEDIGWVGFDISNGISPDERYVQVAYGLDYKGAAPTSGITIGARDEKMLVSIQVQQ